MSNFQNFELLSDLELFEISGGLNPWQFIYQHSQAIAKGFAVAAGVAGVVAAHMPSGNAQAVVYLVGGGCAFAAWALS
jgi:hypothetical protein